MRARCARAQCGPHRHRCVLGRRVELAMTSLQCGKQVLAAANSSRSASRSNSSHRQHHRQQQQQQQPQPQVSNNQDGCTYFSANQYQPSAELVAHEQSEEPSLTRLNGQTQHCYQVHGETAPHQAEQVYQTLDIANPVQFGANITAGQHEHRLMVVNLQPTAASYQQADLTLDKSSSSSTYQHHHNYINSESTGVSITNSHESSFSSAASTSSSSEESSTLTRDERRAREANIPLTYYEIVNLSIDQFNEQLSRYQLTESQLTLIKDIRRRGKNKVAAQSCRKRKMEQIYELQHEVNHLADKRRSLNYECAQLIREHENLVQEYDKINAIINLFIG